jgi:hypothetical protein
VLPAFRACRGPGAPARFPHGGFHPPDDATNAQMPRQAAARARERRDLESTWRLSRILLKLLHFSV